MRGSVWRTRRKGVDRPEGQPAGLRRHHTYPRALRNVVDLSSEIFLFEVFA